MRENCSMTIFTIAIIVICNGCQVIQSGTEIRTEEQMLDISYENDKAEQLFVKIVHSTKQEEHVKSRIGVPALSLYSRYETVAFNAHCNDHIKAMDKNRDLIISQEEAEKYHEQLVEEGKITEKK